MHKTPKAKQKLSESGLAAPSPGHAAACVDPIEREAGPVIAVASFHHSQEIRCVISAVQSIRVGRESLHGHAKVEKVSASVYQLVGQEETCQASLREDLIKVKHVHKLQGPASDWPVAPSLR